MSSRRVIRLYGCRGNAARPYAHRRTRELGTVLDLEPPARQIITLAGAVTDDMLPPPTPCGDYTVEDLLAHFMGLTIAFRDAAAKAGSSAQDAAPGRAVGLSGRDPDWPSQSWGQASQPGPGPGPGQPVSQG